MHSNAMIFPEPDHWCISMYQPIDIDMELRSFTGVDTPEDIPPKNTTKAAYFWHALAKRSRCRKKYC
jgi:hypothetical protein